MTKLWYSCCDASGNRGVANQAPSYPPPRPHEINREKNTHTQTRHQNVERFFFFVPWSSTVVCARLGWCAGMTYRCAVCLCMLVRSSDLLVSEIPTRVERLRYGLVRLFLRLEMRRRELRPGLEQY